MQYKFDVTSITSKFDEEQNVEIPISRDEAQVAGSVGISIKQPSSKAGFKQGFNRTPRFDFKAGQSKIVFKPGQILAVNPGKKIKLEMTLQNPDADMGTATVSSKKLILTIVPVDKKSTKPSPTSHTPSPAHTPTPTHSPSPIHTPSPVSHTPSSGHSPSPTHTPSPAHTPSPTTHTPSPSHSPSPGHTPSPTHSPSPSHIPSPAHIPSPIPMPAVTAADIAKLEKLVAQTQGSLNTMESTLKSGLNEMQSGIKNIQVLEKQSQNLEQAQQEMMIQDNTEVTAEISDIRSAVNQLIQMANQQQAGEAQGIFGGRFGGAATTNMQTQAGVAGNTGIAGGMPAGMPMQSGAGVQGSTQHSGQHSTQHPTPSTGMSGANGSGMMPGGQMPGQMPAHVQSCGQYTTYVPVVEYEIPSDLRICKREFDHACSLSRVTQEVVDGITRLIFPPDVPQPPAPGGGMTGMPTMPTMPTAPPTNPTNPTAPAGTKQPSIPSYYGQIHIPGKPDPQWAYVPNVPIDGTLTTCPAPMKPEAVFDPYTNNVVQACVLRSMSTTPPTTTPKTSTWKPITKYLNDWSGNVEYRFRNGDLELRGEATAATASSKAKANPNSTAPIFWIMDADIMPMIPSMMKVADGGGTYSGVGLWWTVFSPAKDGIPQDMATGANGLVVSAHAASIAIAPISFTGVSLPV